MNISRLTFLTGLLSAAVLLSPISQAQATEYRTLAPQGQRIQFTFTQMGVPMKGHFSKFTAQFKLDPAKPALAQGRLDVDLSSIETGTPESNEEVVGKPWFHLREFPKASFELDSLQAKGSDRFEAKGRLTLKGIQQPVTVPLQINAKGQLSGQFTLQRSAFRIGEGAWAKFDILANDIQVQLQLQLQ